MNKENHFTFLIAEDEEINYLFIETLIKSIPGVDITVLHSINGNETVNICRENDNIDLVLMDIKMPKLNGIEATKLIKEFRPDLPVIAQTAYTSEEDKKRIMEAGCIDFISKPISKSLLLEKIKNHVDIEF